MIRKIQITSNIHKASIRLLAIFVITKRAKSLWLQETMVKKDVKSKVAAKKWL